MGKSKKIGGPNRRGVSHTDDGILGLLGEGGTAPSVTQPKGAGKLPIISYYGPGLTTTVTANAGAKTAVIAGLLTFFLPLARRFALQRSLAIAE
jgi:hypothetical protein